ncbi:PQQ-dependent sugar dehydrogenase [Chitinophaga filiformis]|uniref:PQQ-dependent sugar dehydrogenase n=1 Tax=Chitinophaga filiformis TaxID=104663 RepID=UPI001F25C179|nr:PQQ-dependent sugar dehydrogenase [Chitinophaga filiformis]MCF6407856.1 PQQ-dependent sugar dehydrogenase [Chitinophaga filiformis]
MGRSLFLFLSGLLLTASLNSCYSTRASKGGGQTKAPPVRKIDVTDIVLPAGYRIELVAQGLTFPTAMTFDEKGSPYVIESGYSYGEVWTHPRLLRIDKGNLTPVATGEKNGPWTGVTWHNGQFYVSEGGQMSGGKILKISPEGKITAIAEGLPGMADHHTNGPVIKDNYIYFGVGTATNSGVVGPDNAEFGWLKRHPDLHDIPCGDIILTGANFESDNPLSGNTGKAITGPYKAFNTAAKDNEVVKGTVPCTGAILRVPLAGGKPELVAWGLRNPYALALDQKERLFATENGADDRGSRPLWGCGDVLWEIKPGAWYGWPDYAEGKPVNYFKAPGGPELHPVLKQQPGTVPKPVAVLAVHSSSNGLDFSRNSDFGFTGEAFIAQFGDMAPNVGKVLKPVGFKVVRVNTESGVVETFAVNKGRNNGPASRLGNGGLERPVSVKFSPDGKSLYIVDFGILKMIDGATIPQPNTGVIWKVSINQ